uniref:EGF-like domain-containing protein n=1 Tax=Cercocebus atys TaxID=9531 RepID=A0A2K5L626_CERAT
VDCRKMACFSSSVIWIMAFELALIARLGHQELARPSRGDLAFRNDSIWPQEEPAIWPWSSQCVPPMGIWDSKELSRTCCLNRGTCMLGSFCGCPPSFYGWNCEHDVCKENCGSVLHDTWLPKKRSLCKCWQGQLCCFPQHLMASRTPELPPSACTTLMLAGICLSIQSYY